MFTTTATLHDALHYRYACKVFDSAKKIAPETWAVLEESLILTPSSYGLQPWKFIIVTDATLRESLVPHSWNQRQVADASHLVVMAVKKQLNEADVDAFLARMVEVRGGSADSVMGFRKMLKGSLTQGYMTQDWAKQQAYIALGQFMLSAALLGIDTCPMEGFIPAKFDEALGLAELGLTAAVLCPAGYRHAEDRYASLPKVRFSADDVLMHR